MVEQVKAVIKDKIIIGHALFNDLAALSHRHVYEDVRDTALFYPLRKLTNIVHEGQYPSLRALSKEVLGREIQTGEHSPVSWRGHRDYQLTETRSRTRARLWTSSSPCARSMRPAWPKVTMWSLVCQRELSFAQLIELTTDLWQSGTGEQCESTYSTPVATHQWLHHTNPVPGCCLPASMIPVSWLMFLPPPHVHRSAVCIHLIGRQCTMSWLRDT